LQGNECGQVLAHVRFVSWQLLVREHCFLFEIFGFDFGNNFSIVVVHVIIPVLKLIKNRRARHVARIGEEEMCVRGFGSEA
jgi:hypothetical protein